MSDIQVDASEKFALIAIPSTRVADELQDTPYASDLWATTQLPFPVSDHWKTWIGSIRAEELAKADLILVTKGHSATPGVVDAENMHHTQRISDFYYGLLVTREMMCPRNPFLLTGANVSGDVSIRQMTDLRSPVYSPVSLYSEIDDEALRDAALIADAIAKLRTYGNGVFERVYKILSVYQEAISNVAVAERLHDFCRCIDGLVKSRKGRGKEDFSSRTSMFMGAGYKDLMGEMYEIRNAIAHMRHPDSAVTYGTPRETRIVILERSMQAEIIARYCIRRLLLSQRLWTHFETDDALENFWKLGDDVRGKLWGASLDFAAHLNCVDRNAVSNSALGLP